MPTISPAPTISVKIDGQPVEITMYFGRLNELAELVGGIERVPEISFHAPTRTAALEICLAPRDERGRRTETDWCIPPSLTIEDGEAVLDWAAEHTTDFFIDQLSKHVLVIEKNGARLTAVGASLNGSAASASATP